MQVLWGIGGMLVLIAIAFGLSTNRRAINPRTVFGALAIQIRAVYHDGDRAGDGGRLAARRLLPAWRAARLVLNEYVAFSNFGPQVEQFSQKTVAIVTFGLTRFANFGSIAILIGTFGSISPSRRHEVARFGIRAVFAGTLANLMNATIAGILIG